MDENTNQSVKCFAEKSKCWDGIIWNNEKCYNCPEDLKDICVTDWTKRWICKCDTCPEKLKNICVTDWDDWSNVNCKCDKCPEKLKNICIIDWNKRWICKCDTCPEKLKNICVTDWDDWSNVNCKCDKCPEKLKNICIIDWNKRWICKCDTCPEKLKNICIINWDDTWGTWWNNDCKCNTCPEKLKKICMGSITTGDLKTLLILDEPPVSGNNDWWHIENDNCNICPCEYVDFSTDFTKWDIIRAKLWDKKLSVFYKYSNSVVLESFLDIN